MAHEKTWQYAPNVVHGDVTTVQNQGSWALWWQKQLLIGQLALTDQTQVAIGSPSGLWTMLGSSDGVTAALDGVDRWTTTFTPSKLVWTTSTTGTRSWAVLQAPTAYGTFYWTIDLVGTTAGVNAHFIGSWVAPTGGSITARPTSTREFDFSAVGGRQFSETTAGSPRHIHGQLATDGSFHIFSSKDGSLVFSGAILCHRLAETKAADLYPQGYYVVDFATAGCLRANFLNTSGTSDTSFPGACSDNTGGILARPLVLMQGNTSVPWFSSLGAVPDPVDSLWGDFPLYVSPYNVGGRYSLKGRIADVRLTHMYIGDGQVYPLTGQITDMVVGGVWVPANTAPSL